MPKLWEATVDGHRASVHVAVLKAVTDLAHADGIDAVTMSSVAERAGIGRATLYKYYADLDALLTAWHAHQVSAHVDRLHEAVGRAGDDPWDRLRAALTGYARSRQHAQHGALPYRLHQAEHVAAAHASLRGLLGELMQACDLAATSDSLDELVAFAVHALDAASEGHQGSASAGDVERLVARVIAGLQAS